ncbi:3'-5' exonuclease [Clostridium ganghwense]|uniref:3'-5' exonuclease n=1 Tax=Clostridium ganghwense TaxID=312089 RepID=A0ABT4CJE9_9CLOT|nr:3'-5' exonuclease [Clostridium ganghwense]MCY6369175.1 3'-5' exonuclease [Clostridium ganghwense]
MRSIFLDTETTGLAPGQIAQLTYIIEENKKLVAVKNYFFTVETMGIQAQQVHGFSMERLRELSNGMKFQDVYYDIHKDFKGANFIAHNVKFDRKFVEAEFNRLNEEVGVKNYFCTMEYFKDILKLPAKRGKSYKNPRVEEVMNFYNISPNEVLEKTKKLFKCDDVSFHDARYDTVAVYMCCLKSRNREVGI